VPSGDAVTFEEERTPQAFTGSFVARLISLESGTSTSFIAHLSDCYLPVWRQLHTDNVLSSVSVFELSYYDSTIARTSVCDYLVLAELGPDIMPGDLLDAEEAASYPGCQDVPRYTVLRSTYMSCTPNSCYGMPEPGYQDGGTQLDYLVEFIVVEPTPDFLKKYSELMSEYIGPANGVLVESGMLHCFVALETKEVLLNSLGAVPWNQIHISDDWGAGEGVDWDSVYVEVFRSELSCDLDSVWAELPPTDNSRHDSRGRLIPHLYVR
jgi:hypothetical protein